MSNSQRALDFFDAWMKKDLERIMAAFAEDAVYHNIPMEPSVGKDAIRAYISKSLARWDVVDWITHHVAETANGTVLSERTDEFETGGKRVSVRVMGAMEYRDGLITAWRDYFDLGQFQRQL